MFAIGEEVLYASRSLGKQVKMKVVAYHEAMKPPTARALTMTWTTRKVLVPTPCSSEQSALGDLDHKKGACPDRPSAVPFRNAVSSRPLATNC